LAGVFSRYLAKELKKREDKLVAEIGAWEQFELRQAALAKEALELESQQLGESCEKVESCLRGEIMLSVEQMTRFKVGFADSVDR